MLRERKTSICRRSLIGLVLGILAVGCQQSPTDLEAENERVVREALDSIDRLDFSRLSELFAEDFVLRFVGSPERVGRDVTFELIRATYASFPDQTHVIQEVITEGDRVIVRLTYNGTHQGEYDGLAPTGNSFDYAGIQIYTVVDGVAQDVWMLDDVWTFMSQLGTELPPARDDSPFDQFAGSWRLVSAEGHSSDGGITYDWGQQPLGRVMLDTGGRLSLHLVDPDRPRFESGDFLRPSPDELSRAFNGYFGYFGSYTVDPEMQTITFHVEGAAYPNYIGSDQARFYEFSGDRFVLRTPPERAGGEDIVYYITWEREQ